MYRTNYIDWSSALYWSMHERDRLFSIMVRQKWPAGRICGERARYKVHPHISEPLLSQCSIYPQWSSWLCNTWFIMCVWNVLCQRLKWLPQHSVSCFIVRKSRTKNILDRLAEGEKVSKFASEFGIGNSTMTDVKNKLHSSHRWRVFLYVWKNVKSSLLTIER